MRLLKKFTVVSLALLALAAMPQRADAALLTIVDSAGPTTWTLDTGSTACTTCTITLQAHFTDPVGPATNGYTGDYVQSVQWVIAGADPTAVSLTSTDAGVPANWTLAMDASLNNNGCTGGATDAICGNWNVNLVPGGFGPIQNGSTLTWTFSA